MDATYLSKALKGLDGGKRETLTSFFMCHALCHTVEPVARLGTVLELVTYVTWSVYTACLHTAARSEVLTNPFAQELTSNSQYLSITCLSLVTYLSLVNHNNYINFIII